MGWGPPYGFQSLCTSFWPSHFHWNIQTGEEPVLHVGLKLDGATSPPFQAVWLWIHWFTPFHVMASDCRRMDSLMSFPCDQKSCDQMFSSEPMSELLGLYFFMVSTK